MKSLPAVLTLLFLQQAASTHLETCECHEIKALMNTTIEQAITRLESNLKAENETSKVNAMIENTIIKLENKFNDAIKLKLNETDQLIKSLIQKRNETDQLIESKLSETGKLIKQIQSQLSYHHLLPPPVNPQETFSSSSPAASCKMIHDIYPDTPSGSYWIQNSTGSPIQVYCKMDADCSGYNGGWMRVAYIDMRNSSHQCPSGLTLQTRSSSPRRVCDLTTVNHYSCPAMSFPVHGLRYHHVYGRVIAYQNGWPLAFHFNSYNSIDQAYVYGVSLTHGQNSRKHIWTFAGAADETTGYPSYKCPCINQNISPSSMNIPSFIGNDFFCDTALHNYFGNYGSALFPNDPLWDGQGCGTDNTCCSVSNLCTNSPPWFIKHLPSATTDNVELRFCRPGTDGSTPIEVVEIYVQ